MRIETHKVELKHDEVDTLTDGLIMWLESEMKLWHQSYKTFEDFCKDELIMLSEFMEMGGCVSTYHPGNKEEKGIKFGNHKDYTSVWDWAKARHAQLKKEKKDDTSKR